MQDKKTHTLKDILCLFLFLFLLANISGKAFHVSAKPIDKDQKQYAQLERSKSKTACTFNRQAFTAQKHLITDLNVNCPASQLHTSDVDKSQDNYFIKTSGLLMPGYTTRFYYRICSDAGLADPFSCLL